MIVKCLYDKHIYDISSIIKKVWKIVNCTFLVDMTQIGYMACICLIYRSLVLLGEGGGLR